jgi:putative ABC transport system permease protein
MSSVLHPNSAFGRPLAALRRIPRPILTVLLVFALGLGVNTAIFTFGYLKFLTPYPHADELVVLRPEMQGHEKGVLAADFISWKQQATVFQDLEASTEGAFNINVRGGPEKVTASLVTAGFYRMMGDRFYLGRDFTSEDGTPGKQRVVILAHALWKRLGANPAMIGTIILMDGEPYTVTGVLAPGVRDHGALVTVPLTLGSGVTDHEAAWLNVIGRLKPGVSIREAQANVDKIAARIPHSLSNSNRAWSVSVEPVRAALLVNDRKFVNWLLLGGVLFLLLMECVSVANLVRLRSDAKPFRMNRSWAQSE